MIVPYNKRLLIEKLEVEDMTKSGILLTSSAVEEKTQGTVLNVSSDLDEKFIGNTVIYGKYSGDEIEENDKKFVLISEDDVLGFVVDEVSKV